MTEQQFAYWLQGFAELNPNPPTAEQWQSIREHLASVFQKATPPVKAAPKIDVMGNKDFQDIIERSKQTYQPWPPKPEFPKYFLGDGAKLGVLYC